MASENTAKTLHVKVDVDLDEVRRWAEHFADIGEQGMAHVMYSFLDEHKPKSMAEVEWDDAVHHLAEAETPRGTKMVMLAPDTKHSEYIMCSTGDVWYAHDLTPTGKRFRLVPGEKTASEHENVTAEQGTNSLGKLNSSPEPQMGEVWIVEAFGDICYGLRDHEGYPEWTIVDSDGYRRHVGGDEIKKIHRLAPVAEPRVLRTVEDYRCAPVGTILGGDEYPTREKISNNFWAGTTFAGQTNLLMSENARTVLYWPGEQA